VIAEFVNPKCVDVPGFVHRSRHVKFPLNQGMSERAQMCADWAETRGYGESLTPRVLG
jgi:hypothetical protein